MASTGARMSVYFCWPAGLPELMSGQGARRTLPQEVAEVAVSLDPFSSLCISFFKLRQYRLQQVLDKLFGVLRLISRLQLF
jgi:hypothetical protein